MLQDTHDIVKLTIKKDENFAGTVFLYILMLIYHRECHVRFAPSEKYNNTRMFIAWVDMIMIYSSLLGKQTAVVRGNKQVNNGIK